MRRAEGQLNVESCEFTIREDGANEVGGCRIRQCDVYPAVRMSSSNAVGAVSKPGCRGNPNLRKDAKPIVRRA